MTNKYQYQIKKEQKHKSSSIRNLTFEIRNLTICLLVVLVCIGSIFAQSVNAQATRSITIVPPATQLILDSGAKTEGIMKVINDSDEPITFNATVRDYIVTDTKGTPNFLPPNTLQKTHSAAAWIGVVPSSFTIEPKQKQILNYYIQVPADARPGGHYAGVVYEPASAGGAKGSGASVQTQVGTLFYISVPGEIKEQSLISKFLVNNFSEYGPVALLTQVRNSGDLHISPKGKIEISDSLGRVVETQSLPAFNVFPGAARDFENSLGVNMPMFGVYNVKLTASYGRNNNLPLLASSYFIVFPWKIVAVTILLLVALILAVKYYQKRKNQPKAEKVKTEINTDSKQINADSSK